MPPPRLVDRTPVVAPERLVADLAPPPLFDAVRLETYAPDLGEPTQAAALTAVTGFAAALRPAPAGRRALRGRTRRGAGERPGLYLDGGFGVGKTHLLASLWHAVEGPKAYGTFGELTHLVGALGFHRAAEELGRLRLLCIDEFELDDPGDTVLVSTLLGRLVAAGVRLAATSNTLPDRLGAGRFAADDFLREIQGLAAHFAVVRIDGPDYRHRGLDPAPAPWDAADLVARAATTPGATLDRFGELCAHLERLHPSRYGALLDGVTTVCLAEVAPVAHQAVALRLVVLADRLYDRQVPLATAGAPLDSLFPAEMLAGGYRKKYLRALSRLTALARLGAVTARTA